MTSWTDKAGHRLVVKPADGLNPASLEVPHPDGEEYGFARFWLDGETDLAEVAVAMFAANGQPAPVITPRPDVDVSKPLEFGPLRFTVTGRGVTVQAGAVREYWSPGRVRQVAGAMVAFADAAESEPGPGDVKRLLALMEQAPGQLKEDVARYLLRKGVTLPGEGDGRG